MKKRVCLVLKKIVLAFLLLYGLNYFLVNVHIYVPINYITVGVVSLLGIPGLTSLIILFFIVK